MRILAITNLYPNPLQPHRAPFNRQQFRALSDEHALRVIAPIAWTDEFRQRGRRTARRLSVSRQSTAGGIVAEHPRYWYPPKILRGKYGECYRRCVGSAFARAVDEFQPDIVLAAWAYPDGWAAVKLARDAKLPVVIKVHGSDVLLLNENRARKRPTVEALRSADGIVAVSADLAANVARLGVDPDRISVVYNGVDTNLFSPGDADLARQRLGLDHRDPIVLYVGNLIAAKGLNELIAACASLRDRGERFRCYLVGDGPLAKSLPRSIAQLQLHDRLSLIGSRPLEQLPDWYRAANVLVLPSASEGIPNVLLEAISCGTQFVATDVGGIPEIASRGDGTLVPSHDVPALVNAISEAIARPRSVKRGGASNSWSESARSLARVLERFAFADRARRAA